MAESNELQALEKISTEVDESQIKVMLATQCIKAQAFLVDKLKKQVKRDKETIVYISNANSKLQSEIIQAEQEIKSFHIAKETIRFANVELRKEWLVAKERKLDIIDRVQHGENKYEALWLESKSRYESLPYVQNLLNAAETAQSLKDQKRTHVIQAETLEKEIQDKKKACVIADRKIIFELAEFILRERPKMIDIINDKSKEVTNMTTKLKILNSVAKTNIVMNEVTVEETKATPKTEDESKIINESSIIMPKLQLVSLDIDDLISIKLDQVKMKKDDYTSGLEMKKSTYFNIGSTSIFNRTTNIDESISSYFSEPIANAEKAQSYSRKKLINILEDVQIDDNDAMDMISKVNPGTLQPVETISAEAKTNENSEVSKNKVKEPILSQDIEDIEIASSNVQEIVKPPTQFLDDTLKAQKSQELKKAVSFDLSITSPKNDENTNKTDEPDENDEIIKPLDDSAASDDDFSKMKDMVLKKRNLDLTPPFVYAKNTVLQTKTEEKIVTSKFFRGNENIEDETKQKESAGQIQPDNLENEVTDPAKANSNETIEEGVEDDMMVLSPKKPEIPDELCKIDKPFSGYLFNHGPQGLPDSLDVSINTTGYEDVDDFPHCIDSNLLLSPKADLPMAAENPEAQSQEAPSFLSGLRKTGFSFFGGFPAKDTNPGTSTPNQGSSGFSFNFGGEEKKNRGGLFSMFQ